MNETLIMVLAWAAGGALGAIFFAGLWWTVRKGVSSRHPALWFLGSLLLRMSLVLTGFYSVSGGHWDRLLLCLLGFIMARQFVTWMTRLSRETSPSSAQEAGHAP
jgi:F1F0 ATPase subunit 2